MCLYIDFNEVAKFEEWMRKISNVYRADVPRMTEACKRVTPLKYRPYDRVR